MAKALAPPETMDSLEIDPAVAAAGIGDPLELGLFAGAPAAVKPRKRKSVMEVPDHLAHHVLPKNAPAADRWAEWERFCAVMREPPWRFARTMAANPHNYTLRRWWGNDEDYVFAVVYLRTHGYKHKWGSSWWTQIDVNEHYYWTCRTPIGLPTDPDKLQTVLINRKQLPPASAYDAIGGYYDELFRTPDHERYRREVVAMIERLSGPMAERSVLDVGCGTGSLLRLATPGQYVGVDPSEMMLQELRHRHPSAPVVRTPLANFYGGGARYDLVLSLFGAGSYLSDAELERIPLLLKPGGMAVTMYYAPGYTPEQYKQARVKPASTFREWDPSTVPGTIAITETSDFVTVATHRGEPPMTSPPPLTTRLQRAGP